MDTTYLDKAIRFALEAHSGTERRGKGYPYIIHPLEALSIVATMTNDKELLAAAVLHDTVEDTDVTIEDIRREFGDRVASIVASETDNGTEELKNASWYDRKNQAMVKLSHSSHDAKIVAMGDKLSNMRAIYRDWKVKGDNVWNIFHETDKDAHEWHYGGLASSLRELSDTFAYGEFKHMLKIVFDNAIPNPIDLGDYEVSGDGMTAVSYNHKDGKTMIKLYDQTLDPIIAANERLASRKISAMGLNIPRALRLVSNGNRVGVEFERISPKKSFARIISEQPERLEEIARRFARAGKALHAIHCDKSYFPDVANKYRNAARITHSLIPDKVTAEQTQNALAFLDSVPSTGTCLHGDMHIGNMIVNTDTDQQYWIDLGDFAYGNPMYDMGMFYLCTYMIKPDLAQKLFHMPQQQLAQVWDVFEDEYFGPGADKERINQLVGRFAIMPMLAWQSRGMDVDILPTFMKQYFSDRYLYEELL